MIKLNDRPQLFSGDLFAAFPGWRQFQLPDVPEAFAPPTTEDLFVKIPSPVRVASPISGNWLMIDTYDDEITITYD